MGSRLSDHDCIGFFSGASLLLFALPLLAQERERERERGLREEGSGAFAQLFLSPVLQGSREERVFNMICVLWLREDNQLPDTCFSGGFSLEIRRECGREGKGKIATLYKQIVIIWRG